MAKIYKMIITPKKKKPKPFSVDLFVSKLRNDKFVEKMIDKKVKWMYIEAFLMPPSYENS